VSLTGSESARRPIVGGVAETPTFPRRRRGFTRAMLLGVLRVGCRICSFQYLSEDRST
jgi:hypothetical protein